MTKIISENNPEALTIACELLRKGEVISFATDTVYGIACDACNKRAVDQLYKLKNRDSKKPVAIFVKDLKMAQEILLFDELSRKISEKFLPGKLTLVLEKNPKSPLKLASNLNQQNDLLGFRIVNHPFISKLMAGFSGVLAVSSANLANQKPALSAKEVEKYFANSTLGLIVDGAVDINAKASTVIKIINGKIEILRSGDITESSIKLALEPVQDLF